ncbi:OmpH family outer membrane protein [Urechidicola croceus]|uniref:Molecular chaperone Skp n=1 Tax=Urechidicola croceus TaxID=1850246 RepID=A0A1D8P7U0_9FLAO|nr:OmpH family outer membrane protein [Urechidicola croceus]AOW20643.1 hypothetical protein LPB138_08125 [Urechidicola croceus]
MKKLKTLLLIAVVTLGFNTIQAQSKVAHIDTQALIEAMPETKAMNAELEKLGKTYDDEIKAADAALKAKLQKYEQEFSAQTEEENKRRGAEVQLEEQKLYAAAQGAQQDLNKQRNEKLAPIVEKAQKAIKAVADAQGIQYVLDRSALIVAEGTDLLPAVKANLGIQ